MKICLINPPYKVNYLRTFEYSPFRQLVQSPAIGYLAAELEKNGYQVDVYECTVWNIPLEELYTNIEKKQYDIVGISAYYYNYSSVIHITSKVKHICKNAFLFLGGFYPSLMTEDVFQLMPAIDCCIIGEGEQTCLELVNAINNHDDYKMINGIAYQDNGKIIFTKPRNFMEYIDRIPYPKISYISNKKMVGIVSSRGCYNNCSFCAGSTYRDYLKYPLLSRRSAENIVDEIEKLYKEHNIKSIMFYDENFIINTGVEKERIHRFCELIKDKNIKITFGISVRSNDITGSEDVIKELMGCGLGMLFVGIESFVQRQLDLYNKKVTVAQNIKAMELMNRLQAPYEIGLIYLEPFTSINEITFNINMLKQMKYTKVKLAGNVPISLIQPLSIVQGSTIEAIVQKAGLKSNGPLGYCFQDLEVDILYKYIIQWQEISATFYQKHDLMYKAKYYSENEVYEQLLNMKIKFMELDIELLLDLCKLSSEHELNDIEFNKLFLKYEDLIMPINQEFDLAKSIIDKKYPEVNN